MPKKLCPWVGRVGDLGTSPSTLFECSVSPEVERQEELVTGGSDALLRPLELLPRGLHDTMKPLGLGVRVTHSSSLITSC
jgi:hypothetical protein